LQDTPLLDSALVMARTLSKEKVGRFHTVAKLNIERAGAGALDPTYLAHYVEAFAFWDMDRLVGVIETG
jgi:hypothetical protein